MKHSLRFLRLSLCLALATVTAGVAQIPQRISYQASISDNSGEPIVDGQHALSLSLFDQISGGTAVWTEDHTVTTAGGVVSLVLGASTALDLPFDESYWLGVVVDGGEELAPRVELTTVPYAIRAAGVVDSSITGAAIASGHVVRSIGGLADDIELVAGAGMTITTQNQIMVLSSATGLTSVSSGNIVDATISSIDVADGGLSGVDIADNSLGAVDLAEGSVGTSEVADGSLTASDIASGQVVKSVNGLTDALTLAAGANITITPSGNALTIASTGGGGGGGGSTLDGAYDEGGAGVGRTITADAGAVDIQGAGGLTVAAAVGVGTTSPQKPLHVLDATTATMRLERSAGTNWDVLAAADDKFRIDEAAGTTSPLQIESGAPTNSIYVAADGDVGIGTNAPTTGPPAAQLHVVGTIFAEGNLQNWDGANGVTVTPAGVISASGNPLTLRRLSNGEVRISDDIRLSPFGATDAVVIEATSGEVGIGTTTPGAKLEIVSGDVLISNGWAYRQRVASGTATYLMGVAGGAGTEYMALAMPSLTGEIRFIGVTGSGDEKMRIEDDGDVGIGVAAPIARLDVAGAGNTSGTSSLRVFNTSGVNMIHARDDGVVGIGSSAPVAGRRLTVKGFSDNNMEIVLEKHDSSHELVAIGQYNNSGRILIRDFTSNAMNHLLDGADGTHSAMAFQPSARLGIGTNTPDAKLDVEGGAFLAQGTTGGTPLSGAGTRLMWIPAKSAFRAGLVTSTQFDDANIGVESSVAGGRNNIGSGEKSAIGGGVGNVGSGLGSSIGGGNGNQATTDYSTVAGGQNNQAITNTHVSVGGGSGNTASGQYSTVAGGQTNTASGLNSFVGGGGNNTAFVQYGTISGGVSNQVQSGGNWGSIGGGSNNVVSGIRGTVPGGEQNTAAGARSFAAGLRAKANHDGAFVWGDGSAFDFASTVADEFSARAVGGVRFVSAIDGSGNATAGVTLAAGGGSWSSISDRNMKANFTHVNGRDVLEALSDIPVQTWNYKSQAVDIRHIGPMAQDFHAAFGVGEDNTRITTIDADGVALAAIQGLYEIVQTQQTQIDALQKANALLLQRLDTGR